MPIAAPVLSAIIGAGSSLLGGAADMANTFNLNKRNRTFAKHMYEQQYRDSIAFWNMQNQYNTPSAQMARFKQAGLNPHLIYGQGNPGNAGLPPVPDQQRVNFEAPRTGEYISAAGGRLAEIYDFRMKQAQTNNLEAQNTVLQQDAILRAAQVASTLQGTERSKFDLALQTDLRQTTLEAAREQLRKLRQEMYLAERSDFRSEIQTAANVEEVYQRIQNLQQSRELNAEEIKRIKATTSLLWKDGTLRTLDIKLREKGIMPHDPMYARVFADGIQAAADAARSGAASVSDALKEFWSKLNIFNR